MSTSEREDGTKVEKRVFKLNVRLHTLSFTRDEKVLGTLCKFDEQLFNIVGLTMRRDGDN